MEREQGLKKVLGFIGKMIQIKNRARLTTKAQRNTKKIYRVLSLSVLVAKRGHGEGKFDRINRMSRMKKKKSCPFC